MNLHAKTDELKKVCRSNYWFSRITAEIAYLENLSKIKGGIYDEKLDAACDLLMAKQADNGTVVKADALEIEAMLAELAPAAKEIEVLCASHAHIDMNWMWGYQETVSVTVDTFRTILNLMKEYPTFTFSQSQASVYRIIEQHAPEMIEEIKARIHEGRWEVTASTWVETDKNMPNGESLSRHILYTKRYLSKLFDIDPKSLRLDFEPDTFGHNLSVPEICQNGGVDYYYHCRANDEGYLYNWKSPSGKQLLVFRDRHGYNGVIDHFFFTDCPDIVGKYDFNTVLRLYGVGDHGGGPTRRDVENIMDMNSWPLYPKLTFGTIHGFFGRLEKVRDTLPTLDRELNFVFTGCYTSQSRIKMSNRISEDRIYESEFLSAAANKLADGTKKNGLYEDAWRNILFNHFHDILPGSGIIETREYALGQSQVALANINTNANTAMYDLAAAIDTTMIPFDDDKKTNSEGGGVGFGVAHGMNYNFPQTERGRGKVRAIHLFNSTMYDRAEPVEVTIWDYTGDWGRVEITDVDGNVVAHQIVAGGQHYWGHQFTKILIDAKVPAFGYTTYVLKDREISQAGMLPDITAGSCDVYGDYDMVLENEKIKAVFDSKTMLCKSMIDKATGDVLVSEDRPSCAVRFIKENTRHGMSSWRTGPYMYVENLNESGRVKLIDYSVQALRSVLVYEIPFERSSVKVTAVLHKNSQLIDFTFDVDWHEIGSHATFVPQLNFYMPVAYTADGYKYNIPYSTIDRADIPHDVPANSYMQVKNANGRSLLVVTDTKYGFRGNDNSGAVNLIRGSYEPDPYPEYGKHHIRVGVGSVCGCCARRIAETYVHPVSFTAGTKHEGKLPLTGKLLSVDGSVMTSAVKLAEDSDALLIRVADLSGEDGTVKIATAVPAAKAYLADINETIIAECEIKDGVIEAPIKANSIATILIQ
ncbi:MAG: alpha-mannosidase [Clostridia bacterium]|nr:alpha-mannosidase [Clostridia bacterium]